MTKETTHKLFVYGTLKQGYYNHRCIQGATFVGPAIAHGYSIFNLGGYPGIIEDDPGKVIGELYEITDEQLARCDRLEGVDHENPSRGLYRRERAEIVQGTTHLVANIYIYNGRPGEFIESGVWERS